MAVCTCSHLRHRLVDARAAGVERVGGQIEEVGPADAVAGRAGHLPRQQIEQIGELAPRLHAGLGVGQRTKRIDEEDVDRLVVLFAPAPAANRRGCRRPVGVGLHEDQLGAVRRGGQFVGHAGAAILLLRGGDQQHVALGQDRPQPRQVAVGRLADPFQRSRRRRSPSSVVSGSGQSTSTRSRSAGRSRWINSTVAGSMPSISGVRSGRQTSVGRVVVGRDRPVCTTSAPSSALTSALLPVPVPPSVATTSGASSRTRSDAARSVSRRTSARHFSAGCQAGAFVGPTVEPVDQGIDLGQQFQMGQFAVGHAFKIAAISLRGQWPYSVRLAVVKGDLLHRLDEDASATTASGDGVCPLLRRTTGVPRKKGDRHRGDDVSPDIVPVCATEPVPIFPGDGQ